MQESERILKDMYLYSSRGIKQSLDVWIPKIHSELNFQNKQTIMNVSQIYRTF